MKSIEENIFMAKRIATLAKGQGGIAYYVGGFVRDRIRGTENKDIDIEIHGITPEALEKILGESGTPIEIGKSFGIYKMRGFSIDIAMPRKEKPIGKGHRDFKVEAKPFIGTEKASMRRDFTVNAIMEDVLTGEIIDHFGGMEDLKKGVLRHINEKTFTEDALRVLRGAQFAARFNYKLAPETAQLCKRIDLKELSRERVFDELKKALLKSDAPSLFFETLKNIGGLDVWFPEVKALAGIKQNELYHKEGDVWAHTMMVLDSAVKYRDNAENPMGFMLSALTHDFGKIVATEEKDGRIHSYGHEVEGLRVIKEFLCRLTNENALTAYVLNMAKLHMKPAVCFRDKSSVKATNKLFDEAVSPKDLICLALCDGEGQIPRKPIDEIKAFLTERLGVFNEYMARDYVDGKTLLENGVTPGEIFGKMLEYAHKLRLAGIEKSEALSQTLAYGRKINTFREQP